MPRLAIIFCGLWLPFFQVYSASTDSLSFLQSYGFLQAHNKSDKYTADTIRGAVLEMQRYAHIPQTGILDSRTIAKIRSSRCGLPDVEPETRFKRVKRFSVYSKTVKWEKNLITWGLTRPSARVSVDDVRRALHRAFQIWGEGSEGRLQFVEINGTHNPDIRIGFYVRDHGCGKKQAFDGPGTKLAHAFAPPNGDIHFDDEEDWAGMSNGVSLFWTAVHEIGHSLGFAHTPDERSIMFPYYQDHDQGQFKLSDIDRSGLRYLYSNSDPTSEKENSQKPTKNIPNKSSEEAGVASREPCNTNIDAVASIRGDIFVFKNNNFWWIRSNLDLVRPEPSSISSYFVGFPEEIKSVDAVFERRYDQRIVFFTGPHYYVYYGTTLEHGPRPISDFGLLDKQQRPIEKVDAVFNWGHNGRSYIIARGSNGQSLFWRLDETEERAELTYPRKTSTFWDGVPNKVDAAFTWSYDSSTYFFSGVQYWKFNNQKSRIEPNYPKSIEKFWFRQFSCSPVSSLTLRTPNSSHVISSIGPILGTILWIFIYIAVIL